MGLPPPFWAFAWAGGQALARYVLDHREFTRGKRVLDFASGSGLVAIAAAKAGSARVEASEIDEFALAAIAITAWRRAGSQSDPFVRWACWLSLFALAAWIARANNSLPVPFSPVNSTGTALPAAQLACPRRSSMSFPRDTIAARQSPSADDRVGREPGLGGDLVHRAG